VIADPARYTFERSNNTIIINVYAISGESSRKSCRAATALLPRFVDRRRCGDGASRV
jgi:hypothetical protein